MKKQIIISARLFYGVITDHEEKIVPTRALVYFFSSDSRSERYYSNKQRIGGDAPERFLLRHGFEPVGDSLYCLRISEKEFNKLDS